MENVALIIFSVFVATNSAVPQLTNSPKLENGQQMYRMTPANLDQVIFLHYIRDSDFGIAMKTKIGNIGDAVEFSSSPSLIRDMRMQFQDLNLDITEIYANVTIVLDNLKKNERYNTECDKDKDKETLENSGGIGIIDPRSSLGSLLPMTKINGTELYSGIYYKVGMKAFPNGWMTWTEQKNSDNAHFIQIDLNPNNWPHYVPSGSYQYDNQWSFGESEIPGFYTLMNRRFPKSLATWSGTKIGSGHMLMVSTKPEHIIRLSRGGDWRNDAMWAPIASNQENFYRLSMKQFPRGVITWTYEKYGDFSHYIIEATKEEDMVNYLPGGKWYDDTLFKFQPNTLLLEAKVSNFEFNKGTPRTLLKNTNQTTQKIPITEVVESNESSSEKTCSFDENFTRDNTFAFEFPKSILKTISKTKVQVNLPLSADCAEFSFESKARPIAKQKQTVRLQAQIKVPKFTELFATVHTEWVDKLRIPFTAKMEITGTIERMLADGSGRVGNGPVPADYIQQHIKSNSAAGDQVLQVDSSSGNTLIIKVTGTLVASFDISTMLECSTCHVDFVVLQQSSFLS